MVDMAHFAGLVAAGEHPNPVEHAHVTTTTIHKTLCGPRSGMILCGEELAKDIDRSVFPGQQGGPLMHIIAAKAVALGIAESEAFRARQRQTVANAKAFAEGLIDGGIEVLTGGTDVHLVLVDLGPTGLDGKTAEQRLEQVGITVNRNAIPFDERPPMNPSGLRIGTPALTTRGLGEDDMREIAEVISIALSRALRRRARLAARAHPRADGALPALPPALRDPGLAHPASLRSVARVLFVYSRRNTFTRIDREALAERFEVEEYFQDGPRPRLRELRREASPLRRGLRLVRLLAHARGADPGASGAAGRRCW